MIIIGLRLAFITSPFILELIHLISLNKMTKKALVNTRAFPMFCGYYSFFLLQQPFLVSHAFASFGLQQFASLACFSLFASILAVA